MRRIVLTFGLIAGGMLSIGMIVVMALMSAGSGGRINFEHGEVIGYTSMVVSFLLVYFGVRSYRDNVGQGTITFGRAFVVGLLITSIACVCYVVTWEILYYQFMPDFGARYGAYMLEKARASGATPEQIAVKAREMARFQEMYRNPIINSAMTFVEPFPVGLVFTLVSAGILRRKRELLGDRTVVVAPSPAA